ncbi:MAG: fibrobacter succinogenes major paralogous domain-containing protein [Bacteroidales bacterium]|nr:fibrobacter succinogenes major paralogous domain-containing protein [Bacteroidales bacterium]
MKKTLFLTASAIFLLSYTGCKRFELITKTIYTQSEVSNITYNSVSVSTEILEVGDNLKTYGYCYGTGSMPTVKDSKTIYAGENAKIGIFTEEITELAPNTTYYLRAYAEEDEIRYGKTEQNFTTLELITTPIVTTDEITNINYITATCGGNVTNAGSSDVSERGVCWSTSQNPTISDLCTEDGGGIGAFINEITGLTENKTYYVRAYATNDGGTSYGEEKMFTTAPYQITDIDGNIYNTVVIGNQIWLKENLKVTRYHNGTGILLVEDHIVWADLGDNNTDDAYCYYNNNNEGEADTYGALYTWAAAMGDNAVSSNTNPSGVQGVCPDDWHLPSDAEWKELEMELGMTQAQADATGWRGTDEGGKMKEAGITHWDNPNTDATNESGFTALPGGYRHYDHGDFGGLGSNSYFWSATEYDATYAWYRRLLYDNSGVNRGSSNKSYGFSVRCLRD